MFGRMGTGKPHIIPTRNIHTPWNICAAGLGVEGKDAEVADRVTGPPRYIPRCSQWQIQLNILACMHPWIGQVLVCHFKLWQRETGRCEPEVWHHIVPSDNVVYVGQYKWLREPDVERAGKEYHQLVISAGAQEKVIVRPRVRMLVLHTSVSLQALGWTELSPEVCLTGW